MKHKWKECREIKGYFVDECLNCGALKLLGVETFYVKPCDATKFLTTDKPVKYYTYFGCEK